MKPHLLGVVGGVGACSNTIMNHNVWVLICALILIIIIFEDESSQVSRHQTQLSHIASCMPSQDNAAATNTLS